MGGEVALLPSRRPHCGLTEFPAATGRPPGNAKIAPAPTPPGEPPPGLRTAILAPVFVPTAVVVLALVALSFAAPDTSAALFGRAQAWVADEAGWFTILAVAGFLVFVVGLGASGLGRIRLGPDHSRPDYSYPTWFAMLFAAGMGIGLMFFG